MDGDFMEQKQTNINDILYKRLSKVDDPQHNLELMKQIQIKRMHSHSLFKEMNIEQVPLSDYQIPNKKFKLQYESMLQEIKNYTNLILQGNQKNNLLLYGKAGTGKTYFAESIMATLENHHKTVLFLNMVALKDLAYDFNNQSAKNELALLKRYTASTNLLILDDLGSESNNKISDLKEATNTIQQLLYELSNIRVGRPTIITTNLSKDQIEMTYNEKLVSRIFPKNTNYILNFDGLTDLRNL